MDSVRHALHSAFKGAAEAVLPVRSESAFAERGVLSPAEFVTAGDFLVRACPTWSWEGGDPAKARPYLPKDKQYLITRNVPSRRRAAAVEAYGEAATATDAMLEGDDGDGEGWVAPPPDDGARGDAAPLLDDGDEGGAAVDEPQPSADAADNEADDDDIPGLDDLQIVGPDDWADDDATLRPPPPPPSVVATRTYDLKITYDKYYQVPRFWLTGYDESRAPLPAAAVLDDVSEEHARKTVTVDAWPHGGGRAASIHPCRHAAVMKKLADVAGGGGGGDAAFPVDRYLITFLKFIASVIPTIEYDFTMAA